MLEFRPPRAFSVRSAALGGLALSGCATTARPDGRGGRARRWRRSKSTQAASSAPSPACGPIARPASWSGASSSATRRWSTITAMAARASRLSWGSSRLATDLGLQGHQRAGGGDRRRGHGPDHGAAGPGSGLSRHHLCHGASARHDIERGWRPDLAVRPFPRRRGHARNGAGSSWRRWTIAGAASRSWSATIMESAGCRPMSRQRDHVGPPTRSTPISPGSRDPRRRRASVPARRRQSATTPCMSRPAASCGRLTSDIQVAGGTHRASAASPTPAEHSPDCPNGWCSTAPGSARASCSATRS